LAIRIAVLLNCSSFSRAPLFFLLSLIGDELFDRSHVVRLRFAESLEIQVLNELRERRLPSLLAMVVLLPELLRVETEFSSHLNMGVRKSVTISGIDPRLELLRDPRLLCQFDASSAA